MLVPSRQGEAALPELPSQHRNGRKSPATRSDLGDPKNALTLRVLRLKEVIEITGLGKTTIYQLQSKGDFPQRVKMTATSVGWVEQGGAILVRCTYGG